MKKTFIAILIMGIYMPHAFSQIQPFPNNELKPSIKPTSVEKGILKENDRIIKKDFQELRDSISRIEKRIAEWEIQYKNFDSITICGALETIHGNILKIKKNAQQLSLADKQVLDSSILMESQFKSDIANRHIICEK